MQQSTFFGLFDYPDVDFLHLTAGIALLYNKNLQSILHVPLPVTDNYTFTLHIEAGETGIEMKKQDLTYLNSLAISCLATDLVDTAQPAFELISDAAPAHAAGPIGLASVELAKGNYNQACEILQNASEELKGDSERTRNILMQALVASNKLDEADDLRTSLMELDAANDDHEYLTQAHKFFGTGDPRLLQG